MVAAAEADVVLLPELFATGFTLDPAGVAEGAGGAVVTALRRWAARYGKAVAAASPSPKGDVSTTGCISPSGQYADGPDALARTDFLRPMTASFFLEHPDAGRPDDAAGSKRLWEEMADTPTTTSGGGPATRAGVLQHPPGDARRGRHLRRRGLLRGGTLLGRGVRSAQTWYLVGAVVPRAWRRRRPQELGLLNFGEGASGRYYMEHFEAPFFDCHLGGPVIRSIGCRPWRSSPRGDDRWHAFGCWTPAGTRRMTFYLPTEAASRRNPARNSLTSHLSDPPIPCRTRNLGLGRPKEYMNQRRFLAGRKGRRGPS